MDYPHYNLDKIIDFLIIGGGISGLSVANRLVDLGENPVLIEASEYPSHKICGEFLAPASIPYLQDWDIHPESTVKKMTFFFKGSTFSFDLPKEAWSISRYVLDNLLMERAKKNGASILSKTKVIDVKQDLSSNETLYLISLSNGNLLKARHIFVGSGRIFQTKKISTFPEMPYFGFKAHFEGLNIQNAAEMHLLPNAYLGISQVGNNVFNVAGLLKIKGKVADPISRIESLFNCPEAKLLKTKLASGKMLFKEWIHTEAPEFGIKKTSPLKNVYFIGDAAGTIPPATGGGLAMGVTSGYLAADYAVAQNDEGYRTAWKKLYKKKILFGCLLHKTITHSPMTKASFFVCKKLPVVPQMILKTIWTT